MSGNAEDLSVRTFQLSHQANVPVDLTAICIYSLADSVSHRHKYPQQKTREAQSRNDNEMSSLTKNCSLLYYKFITRQGGLQNYCELHRKRVENGVRSGRWWRGRCKRSIITGNRYNAIIRRYFKRCIPKALPATPAWYFIGVRRLMVCPQRSLPVA